MSDASAEPKISGADERSVRVDLLRAAAHHLNDYVQHSHAMQRMNYTKMSAEITRRMIVDVLEALDASETGTAG